MSCALKVVVFQEIVWRINTAREGVNSRGRQTHLPFPLRKSLRAILARDVFPVHPVANIHDVIDFISSLNTSSLCVNGFSAVLSNRFVTADISVTACHQLCSHSSSAIWSGSTSVLLIVVQLISR